MKTIIATTLLLASAIASPIGDKASSAHTAPARPGAPYKAHVAVGSMPKAKPAPKAESKTSQSKENHASKPAQKNHAAKPATPAKENHATTPAKKESHAVKPAKANHAAKPANEDHAAMPVKPFKENHAAKPAAAAEDQHMHHSKPASAPKGEDNHEIKLAATAEDVTQALTPRATSHHPSKPVSAPKNKDHGSSKPTATSPDSANATVTLAVTSKDLAQSLTSRSHPHADAAGSKNSHSKGADVELAAEVGHHANPIEGVHARSEKMVPSVGDKHHGKTDAKAPHSNGHGPDSEGVKVGTTIPLKTGKSNIHARDGSAPTGETLAHQTPPFGSDLWLNIFPLH